MEKKDTKFKPGVSGNPAGRPVGSVSVVSALKRKLETEIDGTLPNGEKRKLVDVLVDAIVEKAITDKDASMMRDITDRIDGKALQKGEITGTAELKITFDNAFGGNETTR